jgi:5-methyltetrahydrofolate--homocysteine methyltransferase
VVASLLDPAQKEEFVYDIKTEYEELRTEHYASLKDRTYLSLEKARDKRLRLDWTNQKITAPSFLGTKVFEDYPLEKLIPQIDWNPFFITWQLRGKSPNRGYPKIFNDPDVGEEAKKLFNDAQKMLQEIVEKKLLKAKGVIGFYPANTVGDDIELYQDESRTNKVATFYGLRQQAENVCIIMIVVI